MKIAITTENGEVFQHFGHCPKFTVYDVVDQRIANKTELDTSDSGHEALAQVLSDNHIDVLICGGIGGGAKRELIRRRIEIVPGVTGKVEEVIVDYLSGKVLASPDYVCDHHEHNHEGGHCGHHHEHGEGHCGHHHEHGEGHCGHHQN